MDPTDKKRAQPSNSDSAVAPPSERRQLSSAAEGAGQQSAAASAHPMATAAAAALPSAAPAAVAPPVSAGHAALAVIRRLSPAERCPLDPLSVALSFLDVRDFAAASRVCRHWGRSAELQSAWPVFSVERLIEGLIEDDDRWIQSRSVRVKADHLSASAREWSEQRSKWRRLVELHVDGYTKGKEDELVRLGQAAQLPQLQSLHLAWNIRLADVVVAFGSLAPQLMALRCENLKAPDAAAVRSHLHLLANLRVLSLHQKGRIDRALLPLHQLEFLQLRCVDSLSRDLLLAIRRLSVQQHLLHLSLSSHSYSALDLDPLVAELSGADSGLAPAALATIRLNFYLSDASQSALLSLPSLTRLEWRGYAAAGEITGPQSPLPPSPLQQLHLDFDQYDSGAAQLLQQAAVRAPQLQELHISPLPPSFGQLLRPLRRLRLLSIAVSKSPPLSLEITQSLADLPLFSELILRERDGQPIPFQLNVDTLRCIAESRCWRLIRQIGWLEPPQLKLPDDVDARLAQQLADFRVQIEWRGRTTFHRLLIGADGAVAWRQTEM